MHDKSLVRVSCCLKSPAHIAHFHAFFLVKDLILTQCFKLNFLNFEFIDFFHDCFGFFNFTFFSEFFSLFNIEVNFLFQLVNSLVSCLLLVSTHFGDVRVIRAGDFYTSQTTLNFLVNLRNHLFQQGL